jgi:hypothetical protein
VNASVAGATVRIAKNAIMQKIEDGMEFDDVIMAVPDWPARNRSYR